MIRYYRVDDLAGALRYVARERRSEEGLFLERFDPTQGKWIEDTEALSAYLYNGEIGATEITEAEALALAGVPAAT
jgi:hypothetical protein